MGLLYTKEDYNLIEIKSGYIYLHEIYYKGGGGVYKLTSRQHREWLKKSV